MFNGGDDVDNNIHMAHLPHNHSENIEEVLDRMPGVDECITVAEIFKKVGDGSRLRIFWMLCHCEECVSNIAAAMEMSDPAVSHHLRVLRDNGLIVSRRSGKEIYYKIADNKMAELLHHTCEIMLEIACPNE